MSNPIEPENEVPAADRGGDAKSLPESSPAKTHSTRLRACDPFALAQASPLVASIMPGDPLDALTFEYRTLATLAETTGTTPLQRGHYASCLEVCEAYDVAKFRRDLALLLVWSGKLYRLEYSSFREFAKEKANLSRSQAYKAALGALMLLLFDSAGKRHLKPAGDFEAELVKLMPDHWVPAWDAVLAQAPADPELDQVRIELHRYGEGHPSALRVKRQEPGTYLGRLSTLPSSDPPDPPPVHHELELALSQT